MAGPAPSVEHSPSFVARARGRDYSGAKRFGSWLVSAILLVAFWQWYTKHFDVSPALSQARLLSGNHSRPIWLTVLL